jgi:5-methyltetrahydrofolate corrinoid/iron sulfur protein methyltransferase
MIIIGENIHVLSPKVKESIEKRDKRYIQQLAVAQVEKGANVLDLNIGPQKKAGAEIMPWIVNAVQEVTDVPLSLDTTNAAAMEAGLKVVKQRAIINSTDATEERLNAMMPLAAKYDANIIALTLAKSGLPATADARIELGMEVIMPAAMEHGIPMERIYFDPLVMTVNGNQDQAQQTIMAVRTFKVMSDPPPMTTCGLSNVSNTAPNELRPLINRIFLMMMLGAGLDSAIMDALDDKILEAVRVVTTREAKTPVQKLYLGIFDAYAAGEPFDTSVADMSDPDQRDIAKTVDMLENKWLYAHSYLKL